ncbi:kinase-like domain-containing protein, partial [Lasiosphaeria ovina]
KDGETILEFHRRGNLREFLQTQEDLPIHKLTVQIVECLSRIHARGVIHSEFSTANILLDASMNAIVCDFSSSSIDGYRPQSATSIEPSFYRPHRRARDSYTVQDDLFALGSLLYELVTRTRPYQDLKGNEVGRLYRDGEFPPVDHLAVGGVIGKCWAGTYDNASHVLYV